MIKAREKQIKDTLIKHYLDDQVEGALFIANDGDVFIHELSAINAVLQQNQIINYCLLTEHLAPEPILRGRDISREELEFHVDIVFDELQWEAVHPPN